MNAQPTRVFTFVRIFLSIAVLSMLFQITVFPGYAATQVDLPTPPDSVAFGRSVTALPNGNLVVTDPQFNGGIGADAGAVYLFNGATGALISTLTGARPDDAVGSGGVTVLSNGNFVVSSPSWDHGADTDVGAVTWVNATTGVNGEVSFDNSLVGSSASDYVGDVYPLTNGNYVVGSPAWDGAATNIGAATFVNGSTGQPTGWVDGANSLIGSNNEDKVGIGVTALSNGNYAVRSWWWDAPFIANAGAVTFANGSTGLPTGPVTSSNSLVGSTDNDLVGVVTPLTNGNYVVGTWAWDNGAQADAGAATFVNGSTGLPTGSVTSSNSLVGSSSNDHIGEFITALTNGNYVVNSPAWDGAATDCGAATFVNGSTGLPKGEVSPANSLTGNVNNDYVGSSVTALTNGNYVVGSYLWNHGALVDVGAATFVNGSTGQPKGYVSNTNSLIGAQANDRVSFSGIAALTNGNYVVCSMYWNNGPIGNAGAVTWVDGSSGTAGVVTTANSLVGSQPNDSVGSGCVTALSNGHYVVISEDWDNGGINDAGAATWVNGYADTSDVVSLANSLVGSSNFDNVGTFVTSLSNGNYVVFTPFWNNGSDLDTGAVTWGYGDSGITGQITPVNSLVGSTADDMIGLGIVLVLNNGGIVFPSPFWDHGSTIDSGAVTWGSGTSTLVGVIDASNSVLGTAANGGNQMVYAYDAFNQQLVVGRPADNKVTLFRLNHLFLPLVKK